MLVDASVEMPDWQAIHAAFREIEATRPYEDNARPIGSVPLAYMFEQVEADAFLPEPIPQPLPTVPRKTNGFGGRGHTYRSEPDAPEVTEPRFVPLATELERLSTLRQTVEAEIDHAGRLFFIWKETVSEWGETYFEKVYIYDSEQIAEIRKHEREALTIVADALRVSIYERHPRTRGFPSSRRLESDEAAYHNVAHLKSSHSPHFTDPLVQAMLKDLDQRLTYWRPVASEENRTHGAYHTPGWEDEYMPAWRD